MTTISDDIAAFETKQTGIAARRAELESDQQELIDQRRQLIERLQQGESSGDPIRDLAAMWSLGHDPVERLRAIVSEMADVGGQYVMTVERHEDFPGCSGMGYEPQPHDYRLELKLNLGIVPLAGATFEGPSQGLLLSRSVVKLTWPGSRGPSKQDGSLSVSHQLGGLGQPMTYRNPRNDPNHLRFGQANQLPPDAYFEILVGDAAVLAWLEETAVSLSGRINRGEIETFEAASQLLQRELPDEFRALLAPAA